MAMLRGNFYPFVLFTGWLWLIGWAVGELKIDAIWFPIVGLAPIPIAVAYQSWKEDKGRKD